MRYKVWFHRMSAVVWLFLLPAALAWWPHSVLFVIVASVYANIKSDWGAAEAADDRSILDRLDAQDEVLAELRRLVDSKE